MASTSASEAQRAAWGWGTTFHDEEARAFLAQRVAIYAHQVGRFFTALYVFGFIAIALVVPEQLLTVHLHPVKIAHLVQIFLAYGVWWAVQRPGRSNAVLMAGDAVLPLLVNVGAALAAPYAPGGFALSFLPLLISSMALMFRAAFVPSPPRRTVGVGLIASAPAVLAQYELAAGSAGLPGFLTPTLVTLGSMFWSLALVAGTALVSKEIYGLRSEIAKAQRLGQYTLERKLGEGGMGAVYMASHARLRRPTALKLLAPGRMGAESVARFEREVQLTSQLAHPNTVAVYDYGRSLDGVFYYAMEYIEGMSLAELVEKHGPQPASRVVHILSQAADALVEAHGLGLIHRDVKPQNILLCERGGKTDVVKLVDFGLVKDVRATADPSLTQHDTITGTPLYLAPETITDPTSVDHRVDLYALGAVGYCLLTGVPPFQGRSTVEVCGHHLHSVPVPPSQRTSQPLPDVLEQLLLRCLAKKREERPGSARELARALADCALTAPWNEDDARDFWRRWRETKPVAPAPGPTERN